MYMPPTDKLLHFALGGGCALTGIALALLAKPLGFSASPLFAGLLLCFTAAIGREAWNQRQGGFFDWRDIAATLGGSLPVLSAFWLGGPR
jgi:hypothetical protein